MHKLFQNGIVIGVLCAVCLSALAQGRNISLLAPGSAVAKAAKTKAARKPKAVPAAETTVTVNVRAESEVAGRAFLLGQIAEITGTDKARITKLSQVEVGVTPLPGLSRLITPGDITVHLRANHLESKYTEVIAPPAIRITRSGHDVTPDEITEVATKAAADAIKDIPEATLEPVLSAGRITVPLGKVRILAGAVRGKAEMGMLYVPVSMQVDGKPITSVEVAFKVHRKSAAVLATRQIEAGEIIKPEDVTLTTTELPKGFVQPVSVEKDAVGKRARRRILFNAPLSQTALETPPVVSANDRITIEFVVGALRITAPGLARQSGMVGETIRVFVGETKKEMDAVIVKPHLVRITSEDAPAEEAVPAEEAAASP